MQRQLPYAPAKNQGSNQPNPIKRGKSSAWPTMPWYKGNASKPDGPLCRLCPYVFALAGFDAEHANEHVMAEEMQKNQGLTQQFVASRAKMIELVNSGAVTDRLKGAKKADVQQVLASERKKSVELIKKSGMNVRVPHKGMTVVQYMKRFNKDPRTDKSCTVRDMMFEGTLQPCVLFRTLDAGEFLCDIEESMHAVHKEEVDSGASLLRAGQQAAKFKQAIAWISRGIEGPGSLVSDGCGILVISKG